MLRPITLATLLLTLLPTAGSAQTVRFLTSVGAFDMRLNPEGDPNLQGHVDNIVAYIGSGRYHAGVINRAAFSREEPGDRFTPRVDPFVLQLGGFSGEDVSIDNLPVGGFQPTDRFDPVVVDADNSGLPDFSHETNARGTVSLALAAGDANSGTNSFFINVVDNAGLDSQGFVPFAVIDNMATIDRIMNGNLRDISDQVGQPGSLAYIDVPLDDSGDLIVIESVLVVSDSSFSFEGPVRDAYGLSPISDASSSSFASASSPFASSSFATPAVSTTSTPEPTALLLLFSGVAAGLSYRKRG